MNTDTKQKAKRRINRIMHEFELDTSDEFYLEIDSLEEIKISGVSDITEYSENRLLIKCKNFYLSVKGEGLLLAAYSKTITHITGTINEIKFLR